MESTICIIDNIMIHKLPKATNRFTLDYGVGRYKAYFYLCVINKI